MPPSRSALSTDAQMNQQSSKDRHPLLHLGELADLLDLRLALFRLEGLDGGVEEILVVREARSFRNAVVVLAGEQTRSERRPDGRAEPALEEEGHKVLLAILAVEHVVLRLLDRGSNQVKLVGDQVGLLELVGRPLAGTPVEGESLLDAPVECSDGLFDGNRGVRPVSIHNIDIVELESLERRLQALDDVLSAQALLVWVFALGTEEDLGGDNDLLALELELAERFAHLYLGLASSICLCIVEQVLRGGISWLSRSRRSHPRYRSPRRTSQDR